MTYFDRLNEDILNEIFLYLDTYDILNLSIICDTHRIFLLNKVKLDVDNKLLYTCLHCKEKCMNVKTCIDNNNHNLCYNCVIQCDICEHSIGNMYCGCKFSNVTPYLKSNNYGPTITCSCGKRMCRNCIQTNFMTYSKCIDCYFSMKK